jgi:hypothetical protein
LFDESLKGSISLKIFKISLTFRFDKLSNLSKSVHTGENSQILRVSNKNSSLFNEFARKLGLFWHEWTILKRECNERFKGPRVPKKAQFTHERVEYNVFWFDEPLKSSKSLKIFKISLTFRFDKL